MLTDTISSFTWGFKLLRISTLSSLNNSICGRFDSEDYPSKLIFTAEAHSSRFFNSMPSAILTSLQEDNVTMENHHWGMLLMLGSDDTEVLAERKGMDSISMGNADTCYRSSNSGLSYKSYAHNAGLQDFFTVTSLSLDRQGLSYVSTMEAKQVTIP